FAIRSAARYRRSKGSASVAKIAHRDVNRLCHTLTPTESARMRQNDFAPQGALGRAKGAGEMRGASSPTREHSTSWRRAQSAPAPRHVGYWKPTLLTPRGHSEKECQRRCIHSASRLDFCVRAVDAKRQAHRVADCRSADGGTSWQLRSCRDSGA